MFKGLPTDGTGRISIVASDGTAKDAQKLSAMGSEGAAGLDPGPVDKVTLAARPLEKQSITDPSNNKRVVNKSTRTEKVRICMPGTVVSGSGATYSVQLLPDGVGATAGATVTATDTTLAAAAQLPAGTRVWVYQVRTLAITVTTVSEGENSTTNTEVRETGVAYNLVVPKWL